MDTKKLLIVLIILGVLVFFDLVLGGDISFRSFGFFDSVSSMILFWTFLVLIWYSYETYKIKKLAFTPVIAVYYKYDKANNIYILRARNIGKGPALDVRFSRIKVFYGDIMKQTEFYLSIYHPRILVPNEERDIAIIGYEVVGNNKSRISSTSFCLYSVAGTNINNKLSVRYKDIDNDNYLSKFIINKYNVILDNYFGF